jgi:hypothetical protein
MNPLPAIIKELPALADALPHYEAKLDVPLGVRKFVLCITKDLKEEDLALFKEYRVVEYDDQTHRNIPIDTFAWDFLVLDLREKGDRYCLLKEVYPKKHKYNVIVYCHGFESEDVDVESDNVLTSFPMRQARKEDFELLLLTHRVKKPRWYMSLMGCILNFYNKTKK